MLVVKDLSFGFRHRHLFKNLSLKVGSGELLHLVGPNGAGKSTLISIIAGLMEPNEGTISYYLEDGASAPDRRAYMEYLPAEANGLYVKLDAVANLRFWSRLRGCQRSLKHIHGELEKWNLNHPLLRDNFPVQKFSTGMKRRLALARLGLSPALCWLLDEPVYGLDQEAVRIFKTMLASHLDGGGFGLVVSHERGVLEGLTTQTITLDGR